MPSLGSLSLGSPLTDRRTAFLLVGVLAAAVYLNSLPNEYAYDDRHIILNNEDIQSIETLPGALVAPYWPHDYGRELGLWRPVATAIYGIEWIAGGGHPLLFHVVNVALHVAATLVVLALLLELISLPAAFAGGSIFAVHPVHVEAVANVVGLAEVLSTLCVVGACLVHIRGGPISTWRTSLLVGLLYLVGFGTKESAVTLPGLILLVDAARGRLGLAELPAYLSARWRAYCVMLVVAVGMLVGRYLVLGSIAAPFAPLGAHLLEELPRIWTLGEVWMHYVRLWVFPLDLSADYSPNVIPITFTWQIENVLGVTLALVILMLSLIAWRRPAMEPGKVTSRAAAFGVVWFLIAISPTSNALFLSGVLLAERTLYLPSVGLAAATGWLCVRLAQDRRRLAWGGLTVAVLASSVRVWTRNPTWRDTETALATLVRDYPQAGRSQWILGDQFLAAGRVDQALFSYRAAINALGSHYTLLTDIARRLRSVERYGAAERLLELATRERPDFSLAYSLLALIRSDHWDPEGAERYARRTVELEPTDVTRWYLLAWALAAQDRMDEAREVRAHAEAIGHSWFWATHMYDAYDLWDRGDSAGAYAALDSTSAWLTAELGRAKLDSVRVTEFGLEPLRQRPPEGSETRQSR